MTYFLNQYPKFEVIFEDGRIKLDKNLIENAISPLALVRKNFLFAASHRAAQHAATLYFFFGSCKMYGINSPGRANKSFAKKIPDDSIQKPKELLSGYQKPSL